MWTALIGLIAFSVAIYLVYSITKARREQQRRSQERAAEMLLLYQQEAARAKTRESAEPAAQTPPPASAPISAPASAPTAAPTAAAAPAPAPLAQVVPIRPEPAAAPLEVIARKPRVFNDAQRVLHLVLKAGLPEHIVLFNQRIVDLVDLPADHPGPERDPKLREYIRHRLDFVVCGTSLEPIVGIVILDPAIGSGMEEQLKQDFLKDLGIRFLRFRADSLPKPNEIRGFVLK